MKKFTAFFLSAAAMACAANASAQSTPSVGDKTTVTFNFTSLQNCVEYTPDAVKENWVPSATPNGTKFILSNQTASSQGVVISFDNDFNQPDQETCYFETVGGIVDLRFLMGGILTVTAPENYEIYTVTLATNAGPNFINSIGLTIGQTGTLTRNNLTQTWTAPEEGGITEVSFTSGGTNRISTITVVLSLAVEPEVPAETVTIDTVTLAEPSFNHNATGNVTSVTAGQSVNVTATVLPANTTDELVLTADVEGVTVSYDETTGVWTVSTEGIDEANLPTEVTITAKAGETTATYTFGVKAVLLGDSNSNGQVSVADVVTTANYVAQLQNEIAVFNFPNANVVKAEEDGEEEITVEDITATVSIIMGEPVSDSEPMSVRRRAQIENDDVLYCDNFEVVAGEQFIIPVTLENNFTYAAMQVLVHIPEGMTLHEVTNGPRTANHFLIANPDMDDPNLIHIVIYSLFNESFKDIEGSVFNLVVSAEENCGNIVMLNPHASDARSNGYDLTYRGGINLTGATGVEAIGAADAQEVRYFDLTGCEVRNPESGRIVIRVAGGKAEKVIF